MSRARQQKQSAEVRARILDTAKRIVTEEGAEALSIRRVTTEMGYSAGIVYHYFENKEQILSCILREGYDEILSAIKQPDDALPPDEAIRVSFVNYVEVVMRWTSGYKALMLDSSPRILEFTSVLGEGCCEKRPAMMALVSSLEQGISDSLFTPCDTRLTAQALWGAAFGLVIRMIIEGDVSAEQRARLIERQIDLLLKGLRL
jgi:AcrR family transcriptional regulator